MGSRRSPGHPRSVALSYASGKRGSPGHLPGASAARPPHHAHADGTTLHQECAPFIGSGNRVLRTSREEGALELTVIPIRTSALRRLRSRAVVALQLMDMTRFEWALVNTMRERYRFAPAESRCVDPLCHGLTLNAIASHLKISASPVKTHLRSVFGRTGTTRQAERVALLNGHAPPDAKISSR